MRRGGASGDRWRLWTVKPLVAREVALATDPVVVAAGDIAEASGHQRLTSDRVLELDPDRVLLLGDNQYRSGTLAQYQRFYGPTWGRFKARTRPVPGNHEYKTPRAAGYFAYFGKAARPKGRSYYSFDLGGWHLVALNSSIDHGPGSAQERWLRADLVATAKRCILAYWHFPRFSSGAHQGNWGSLGSFWNDLYAARADVVLSGHEHSYERFARQTPWAKAQPPGDPPVRGRHRRRRPAGLRQPPNRTASAASAASMACSSWSCTRPATSGASCPRTAPCSTGAARSPATETVLESRRAADG